MHSRLNVGKACQFKHFPFTLPAHLNQTWRKVKQKCSHFHIFVVNFYDYVKRKFQPKMSRLWFSFFLQYTEITFKSRGTEMQKFSKEEQQAIMAKVNASMCKEFGFGTGHSFARFDATGIAA